MQRLAGGLHALGLRVGDRVGLYLPMIPEAVVTFLACASLGLITVPIFSGSPRTRWRPGCGTPARGCW